MTKAQQAAKLRQAMDLLLEVEKEYTSPNFIPDLILAARRSATMAYNEINNEDRRD